MCALAIQESVFKVCVEERLNFGEKDYYTVVELNYIIYNLNALYSLAEEDYIKKEDHC